MANIEHFEQAAKKLKNQKGMAVDEASNNSNPNTELSDGESSEDVQEDSPLIAALSAKQTARFLKAWS
ncbi:hypothetical protein CROQUDRAFT_100274 [Cronartium quercuum f. sp. fusiforme G11]|uniref:Uncharacterized protein n=1 Tax=Cronartium quercuum f. sp. fusiforme G11 TaxID=708437 RepID=A0A9P6NAA6_9BASI|nr:hypothetical protein CROQUDRAFT_100274 [Cronartium quercuum f. sp. fusiforme G11]